jgi:cell division protease FtsH
VTRWGMSDELGMVQLAAEQSPFLGGGYTNKSMSEATAQLVDAEVRKIIHDSHEQAKGLLRAHKKQLDALVEALLARDTLGEQEILEVTGLKPAPVLESTRVSEAMSAEAHAR